MDYYLSGAWENQWFVVRPLVNVEQVLGLQGFTRTLHLKGAVLVAFPGTHPNSTMRQLILHR